MSVREAKKLLKKELDKTYPDRRMFKLVKWKKSRKSFLCENIWGQRLQISIV